MARWRVAASCTLCSPQSYHKLVLLPGLHPLGVGTLAKRTSATPFFVTSAKVFLWHLPRLFFGHLPNGHLPHHYKKVKVYLLFHFFRLAGLFYGCGGAKRVWRGGQWGGGRGWGQDGRHGGLRVGWRFKTGRCGEVAEVIMKLMVVMEMGLDKEFDLEVKWEVNKEVAKDVLMFIMW